MFPRSSLAGLLLPLLIACSEPQKPEPIEGLLPASLIGSAAVAQPVAHKIPAHPHLAPQGHNSMHADSYNSGVHPYPAPLGRNPELRSRRGVTRAPGGQCATLTFTAAGELALLCSGLNGFQIQLWEPDKLELLDSLRMPIRPSTYAALIHRDRSYIMNDSSGAYLYLDDEDRIVTATSDQTIRRIAIDRSGKAPHLREIDRWDLSAAVPHDCVSPLNWSPEGECDPITAVMPDYDGLIWWVTRQGRIGTLNPEDGSVTGIQLAGEEIQNGFAVAEDGVYIVSDHALYQYHAGPDGEPVLGWREPYDRGSARKVGSINQGSGSTPTLLGDRYITITDNADTRINLNVYRRDSGFDGERLVCSEPLFEPGHSATDNSMIAVSRSIVIENNAGYSSAYEQYHWTDTAGGISRVDIRADGSGCDTIWTSEERSPSVVPKLSSDTGLVYAYTFDLENDEPVWAVTAIDFASGETRFKIRTGRSRDFDNNWSPITISPEGTLYVGTSKGLIALRDAPQD